MTVSGSARTYTYDALGRLSQRVSGLSDGSVLTETFTYSAPSAAAASGQVATMRLQGAGLDVTYSYTYDDNGNILTVSDGTNTTSYTYDKANQLIREDNQGGGFTHVWSYDTAGNILSRTEYGYTTGSVDSLTPTDTVDYTYGDTDWGDLLTAYDGVNISYDGIGNPLSDGTWSYTWEHGRELAAMTDGSTTWSFAYDVNGLRASRTNGTTTYSYVYNGSSLSKMTVGTDTLYFTYGAEGHPLTLTHNGTTYFYATNLQGDVVAILNASGAPVVRYTYDAWGNPLTVTDTSNISLATLNPLRYRGYVFDPETGLYYLQSRYYDPSLGRFLNADAFVSTGQGQLGNNMFAYCGNNPIMHEDDEGTFAQLILYAFVHMCVQIDIVEKYGYAISVYVSNNGVKGYLDLYDPSSNSYYEVKSKGVYESGDYVKQLLKYNGSIIRDKRFEGTPMYGQTPVPDLENIAGIIMVGEWKVEYSCYEPGLIVYDMKRVRPEATYSYSPNYAGSGAWEKVEKLLPLAFCGAIMAALVGFDPLEGGQRPILNTLD